MSENLGCGHCGRSLDCCNCGLDYEIVYRSDGIRFDPEGVSSGLNWLAIGGAAGMLLLLRVMFFG